jgi:tRNA(Ile)-lysidine synthase TilS/MesJ
MKRGMLYSCCREQGFNKLVLAQHLDDVCESFIMSAMHNGCVRTMKAKYTNNDGDVCIIRPLVYTREAATKKFAYEARLPVINENCPACFEEPKERHRVKKMLAKEKSLCPTVYANMRRALVIKSFFVRLLLHGVPTRSCRSCAMEFMALCVA